MARLFEEGREEVWKGIRIVLALFIPEFVNDWARSSPILDEFANVHGFDHEHVQIVFPIVVILICVFLLVLFEMALRRNAAKNSTRSIWA